MRYKQYTSEKLTPEQRQALEAIAEDHGFYTGDSGRVNVSAAIRYLIDMHMVVSGMEVKFAGEDTATVRVG